MSNKFVYVQKVILYLFSVYYIRGNQKRREPKKQTTERRAFFNAHIRLKVAQYRSISILIMATWSFLSGTSILIATLLKANLYQVWSQFTAAMLSLIKCNINLNTWWFYCVWTSFVIYWKLASYLSIFFINYIWLWIAMFMCEVNRYVGVIAKCYFLVIWSFILSGAA